MVGPSSSEAERDRSRRRLVAGFVALVGVSAGLVALQADPSPVELTGAVALGALIGAVLVRYVLRLAAEAGRN